MTTAIHTITPDTTALFEGSVCTMGVFDGLHRGHAFLIAETLADAARRNVPSVIITFSIDPDDAIAHSHLKITSNDKRIAALVECGADAVAILPFTDEFAATEALDFLDMMFGRHTPAAIHVGTNFRFGNKGAGTTETLAAWGDVHGMEVFAHDLLEWHGDVVSSTRIRTLLSQGDLDEARELLGHDTVSEENPWQPSN